MFGVFWRFALFGLCVVIFFIPLINILALPVIVPLGAYCVISGAARVWRRNNPAPGITP